MDATGKEEIGAALLVVLVLGFSPVHPVQAYIPISGTVTWTIDQIIATDVVVLNGALLTIQSGVSVTMQCGIDPALTASVDYATSDGTATAGADYTTASGTLTWAAGNTNSQTFSIPLLDDSLVEGDETVILTLSNPVGAVLGAPADSVLIIRDNDVAHFIYLPVILK